MIGLILLAEGIGVMCIFIYHQIKINAFVKNGGQVLQSGIETVGRVLTFTSFLIIVFGSKQLGGSEAIVNDETLLNIYFVVSITGFFLFYVGSRFRLSAYQSTENTDRFVKSVVSLFKAFWA